MHAGNVALITKWCFLPCKSGELRLLKGREDSGKPGRRLGMAMARIVTDAIGMRHKQCRHCDYPP